MRKAKRKKKIINIAIWEKKNHHSNQVIGLVDEVMFFSFRHMIGQWLVY
jgi:hypothetical protein